MFRILALGLLVAAPAAASAATPSRTWIISTRRAPGCDVARMKQTDLSYRRLDEHNTWSASNAEEFHETDDPDVPTVFFIHGNQIDDATAIREGWWLRDAIRRAEPDRPMRFVIWSWPATRIRGRIRTDVQTKATRSDAESYYFARCLDRMDARVKVSAVGHSFGARIILGALEMLAGGEVAGRRLPEQQHKTRSLRAVLVAAALDNGSLLPGRRNGQALGPVDRLLITRNGNDRVLRWYPRMYGRGGPEALGYTGPACPAQLGEMREKTEILGLSCSVGKSHGWHEYLASSALRARLAWYAFLDDSPPATKTTPE